MKTITMESAWTYCTPLQTIDFAPGKHEVSAEIAEAHAKETANGNGLLPCEQTVIPIQKTSRNDAPTSPGPDHKMR